MSKTYRQQGRWMTLRLLLGPVLLVLALALIALFTHGGK